MSSLLSGAVAVGILNAADAVQVLRVAALLYFGATALALRIPPSRVDRLPDLEVERDELRSPRVRASAAAMGVLRGAIGFLVFLVAFGLKRDAEPLWFFGAVAAASVSGGLIGTIVSPALRHRLRRDEPLLVIALTVACVVCALAAVLHSRPGEIAAVFAVALGANIGRQSFDSVLQREAPDAAPDARCAVRDRVPTGLGGRRGCLWSCSSRASAWASSHSRSVSESPACCT